MKTLSNQYRPIDTLAVAATLQSIMTDYAGTVKHIVDGAREQYEITLTGLNGDILGDAITPKIIMTTANDGSQAYRIYVGCLRWVCMNGLVGGDLFFFEKVIHRIGPVGDRRLAGIAASVRRAVEYVQADFLDQVVELASTELTEDRMIQVVGNLPQISKTSKEILIRQVLFPDTLRRPADRANNIWTLWNMVNERIKLASRSETAIVQKNQSLLRDIKELAA